MSKDSDLPSFKRPPVHEVVVGVQFDSLDELDVFQLGGLRDLFKEEMPEVSVQPRIEPSAETFGSGPRSHQVQFRMEPVLFEPRCWFVTAEGDRLIQIQKDRFLYNWRGSESEAEYPRYHQVRTGFHEGLVQFCDWIRDRNMGELTPNLCEITYLNRIPASKGESGDGIERILQHFQPPTSLVSNTLTLENAQLSQRYIISNDEGEPCGRLHISLEPRYDGEQEQFYSLQLMARGKPNNRSMEGVMNFLDKGHVYVVKAFEEITSSRMQDAWEKQA